MQAILPRIARLSVAAEQVGLIGCLADSMGLDDLALRERATQLAWRRLVAQRLDDRWAGLLHTLQRSLDQPPHVALVSSEAGVPSEALLTALAASLGLITDPYRQDWSRVLQRISARGDGSTTDTRWHTDNPGWPRPNDITCLLCVQQAESGGETQVLPWSAVYVALSAKPGLLDRMCTFKVPWVLDSALGGDEVDEPIITVAGMRYMREAFERAGDAHPEQAAEVFDLYEVARALLDAATDFYPIRLAAGEVLIFDNRRCLHRRGPMGPEERRERTLIRARLHDPPGRAPPHRPCRAGITSTRKPTVPAGMVGRAHDWSSEIAHTAARLVRRRCDPRPQPAVDESHGRREKSTMSVLLESSQPTRTSEVQPTALLVALREVAQKRDTDLVRFRTCCADPRASK